MIQQGFEGASVLITGGLGFIGSNLAHALVKSGARVTIADSTIPNCGANPYNIREIREDVELCGVDLRDRDAIAQAIKGKEFIFNLAGQVSHIDSMVDPQTDLELNVRGHIELLEACRKGRSQAAIVFASTRQVYGRPSRLPVDETHPGNPIDVNGINKLAAEHYHLLYARIYGLRCSVLRLTNTYGPRQLVKHNRQGFIGWFVRQIVEGTEIEIYGDGLQLRDLTYVDDVVNALCLAVLNPKANGEVFNLGGLERISLKQLVELMIKIRGTGSYSLVPFPREKKTIDIGNFYADHSKITRDLGWSPRVGLEEGMARTIEYYLKHIRAYT